MIRLKRPLVILAIIFSFGISSAAKTKPTFMPLYFTAAALSVLAVILRKRKAFFNAGIFFLVFLLGMASLVNARVMPSCHISGLIPYIKEKTYIIKGHIADAPAGDKDFVSFRLDAEQVYAEGRDNSCCGQVIVYTRGSRKDWHYGQSVILRGSLYRPFLRSQGIDFIMRVKSDADISRLDGAGGSKIIKIALGIKNKIERAIFRHVASGAAGILDAMVLGEKSNVPFWVTAAMMKSGTIHILVVSGFNVGLVSFVIILLLKILRIPRRWRIFLTAPLLILYCLITGASNPVIRATVMALVFIYAGLFKREADIYNSLSIAAIFILALNPNQLFDIGFQLSFASVWAIVWLYPRMRKILRLDCLKIKFLRVLTEGCLVSVSAWIGTMGFIAYYFKIFAPVTVFANILIVPLASLITLCGFGLIGAESALPGLAPYFARSCESLIIALVSLNEFFVRLPWAYFSLA